MDKQIFFQDKKVNFRCEGEGETLVFLHGFTESLEMWNKFSQDLSGNFKVISIDLPGHGSTEVFQEIHSMELMADVVKAVLDSQCTSECVMIGHSMGGYTALAFAKKYPDVLKGFCLLHSHAGADSEEAKNMRENTINAVTNDKTEFIQDFVPDLFAPANKVRFSIEIDELLQLALKTTKEGIISALRGMKDRKDGYELLRSIKKPVLFIAGENDKRIPVSLVKEQVDLSPKIKMVLLENVGHMGFIEAKEETLETIRKFVVKT